MGQCSPIFGCRRHATSTYARQSCVVGRLSCVSPLLSCGHRAERKVTTATEAAGILCTHAQKQEHSNTASMQQFPVAQAAKHAIPTATSDRNCRANPSTTCGYYSDAMQTYGLRKSRQMIWCRPNQGWLGESLVRHLVRMLVIMAQSCWYAQLANCLTQQIKCAPAYKGSLTPCISLGTWCVWHLGTRSGGTNMGLA
jgi:hypothetical protein